VAVDIVAFLYRFGSVSVRTVWKTDFTELLIRNVTWHWSSSLFRLHFVCSSKFLAVTEEALILDSSLYFSLFLFILFSQIYFSYVSKNQCNSVRLFTCTHFSPTLYVTDEVINNFPCNIRV